MRGTKAPKINNRIPIVIRRIVVCVLPETGIALSVAGALDPADATTNVAVVVCVAPVTGSVMRAVTV